MEQDQSLNLGALERKPDNRDILLGAVQAPVSIPASYIPDVSWLKRNYQGQTPTCGAHAASHFQAILEHNIDPAAIQRYSPRYLWTKIKQIDGFALDAGTDMRSIFKVLQNAGADDFEPLENDVTLPLPTYSSPSAITADMDTNAANKKINSYGFGNTDFDSLCQYIFQKKAVLLLIKCDDQFWQSAAPVFTTPKYGHFITAFGYDENSIRIIDSADPNDPWAIKTIDKKYITSQFFFESGTAIDLPPAVKQALTTAAPIPASVSHALTTGQVNLAEQILNDIEAALKLIAQEI
jgi:hypothetical protein